MVDDTVFILSLCQQQVRHSCLNFYPSVIKFCQSFSHSVDVCIVVDNFDHHRRQKYDSSDGLNGFGSGLLRSISVGASGDQAGRRHY